MTTESKLIEARDKAQKELDYFRARPKIQVYKNMPVIVNGDPQYASHMGDRDQLIYFPRGVTSHTNKDPVLLEVSNWQLDYDRPSLLNFRPVNQTIPEHGNWLVRLIGKRHSVVKCSKRVLVMEFKGYECLPLYEDIE